MTHDEIHLVATSAGIRIHPWTYHFMLGERRLKWDEVTATIPATDEELCDYARIEAFKQQNPEEAVRRFGVDGAIDWEIDRQT